MDSLSGSRAELDKEVRSVLRTLDEYLQAQKELELLLKPGYMELAAARYSAGSGNLIGADGFPAHIEPRTRIRIESGAAEVTLRVLRTTEPATVSATSGKSQQTIAATPSASAPAPRPSAAPAAAAPSQDSAARDDAAAAKDAASDYSSGSSTPAARRKSQEDDFRDLLGRLHLADPAGEALEEPIEGGGRPGREDRGDTANGDQKAASKKAQPDSDSALPEAPTTAHTARSARRHHMFDPACDPLRWFGVLNPPSLKKAQASFSGALEAIATAASLRARAAAGMKRVADLKRRLDSESE